MAQAQAGTGRADLDMVLQVDLREDRLEVPEGVAGRLALAAPGAGIRKAREQWDFRG
jgi:hypothetical protein